MSRNRIRDRLKGAARRIALKALRMEKQAEEIGPREPAARVPPDLARIPRVVDGSGDTPGPNHKTRIGRPWVAAQLASGVGPAILDVRTPQEHAAGIVPGSILLPGEQVRRRTAQLPPRHERITVVGATGGPLSERVAAWLREQGWTLARQLQGGWAEWLEQGETTTLLPRAEGCRWQVGDPVVLADGRRGVVQAASSAAGSPTYDVLLDYDSGEAVTGLPESELRG